MKKLLKSIILWDSWTMHVHSWLVNNCRPNKKKKKRERKTQNTKRKCQINLNPNGYWVLASAPVKPHPLPTPHSSWENIIIKQERKECYKKNKKGNSTVHQWAKVQSIWENWGTGYIILCISKETKIINYFTI